MKQAIRIAMVGGALVAASSALGQLSQSGVIFKPAPGSTDTFSGTFQVSYPTQPTQGAKTFPVTGNGGFVTFFTKIDTSPILQGNAPQVTGGRIYSTQGNWSRPLVISSEPSIVLQDGELENTVINNGVSQTVFKRSVSTSYVLDLPLAFMPVGESTYKVVLVSGETEVASATLKLTLNGEPIAGTAFDGYLNGSIVFFDGNINGVLDGDEPSTLTDRQGHFDLNVDLDVFDTNKNGKLDTSEGRLVLKGGVDMSTGTESTAVLIAPAGSTVVTPLTTIVDSVLRADATLTSVADAETIVKAALGLPEVELTKFDPFKAVTDGGTNALAAVQLQSIAAQVSDTIQQLTAVVSAAADGKVSDQAISAAVVKTVVASIVEANNKGDEVDLASKDTILAKVDKVATETGVAISAEVKATVAEVISANNDLKQRISATAEFDSVQSLVEIAMAQTVSQVKAVEALTSLAAGLISADDVLGKFTGDALEQRVSEAPKADFLAVDTRPGTFRIVSKSALVSESGVNYEPLMVKREDGAFGNVNVRLVFAASSRLKKNVVEFKFRDGEIVRTLNPSDVLVDDAIPQSDEDFVVELKLAADAPQGALLGGQDSATLRVIDNDVAGSVGFEASSFEVREGGPATKPVALVREGGLAGTIRVNVAPSSGTAVVGQDLPAGAILVEFLPGQRRKVVDLGIVDDVIVEGTEDFTVSLTLDPSTATGSALTQGSTVATVRILDNDVAVDTRLEARLTATGAVRLRAWGTVGIKHRLEASTDLKTWAPVGNSTFKTAGAVSAVEILTENPVAAGKFLRLVEVP